MAKIQLINIKGEKLKDITLADKDAITRLGAKGIVEIENQLKIIFGPNAKTLKKYISEMK